MKKNTPSAISKPKSKINKLQSLRVLIVEDSEDDVLLIIRELKRGGYNPVYERVETATAMKKALQEKPWDIILCDYKLPKFTATSAIAVLRETNIDIPLIIVSGTIGEETAVECMRSGAQDYIMKNNLSRLCQAIARELKEAEIRSKHKQMAAALQQSEEKYHLTFASTSDVIFTVDSELKVSNITPSVEKILGYKPEELINKFFPDLNLMTPESLERAIPNVGRVLSGVEVPNVVYNFITKEGLTRIGEVTGSPIVQEGKIIGVSCMARDITERVRAEEALKESEKYFKEITENSSDIIVITDKNGDIKYCSRSIERFTGYKPEELIGRNTLTLIHPDDKKRAVGDFGKAILTVDSAIPNAFRIMHKDGSERYFEGLGKNLLDNPAVAGFIMNVRDITERKQAESQKEAALEALRQSEYLLRKSQEVARLGSYNLDAIKGTWISSPILDDIFGIDDNYSKDVNGWVKILHPEHREEMLHYLTDYVLTGHHPFEKEYQIIRQNDGQARWVFGLGELTFDKKRRVTNMIGTIQDITERKHAEDELYKKHEELQTIIESSPIMIYFKDTENRYLRVNKALAEITGLSKEEIEGKSNEDINPRQAAKIWEEDKEIIATGKPKIGIVETIKTRKGLKILQTDKVPYKDKEGKIIGIVGFSVDISEKKKTQEELLKSEEKYRSIVENAQEGIFQSTRKGQYITLNPAFAHMLGYESPEDVMATITDIARQLYVNPQDREKLLELVGEKGSVTDFETEFYRKDGSRIWVSVNMHAVRDDQGHILYYQGIDQDITEKKKIEAERQENIERLRKSLGATINAMAVTVETRDPYTAGHQRRVADLARAIATEMNLKSEQIDGVRMASMIHDIGKISIPSEILTKPTQLTNLEFNLIKTHPVSGNTILKEIEFPWPIARIVLEHHERIDGSGYPNGLKGEQILLESRIIAIADVVEAISSHRPYRPAHGIEAALAEISKNKGILYDPDLVDACLRLFREKNYNLAA